MLSAGYYTAKILENGWGINESKGGTPQFYVRFRLTAFIQDGEETPCQSEERTIFRALTDAAIDYAINDLKALGWTGTDFNELLPDHEKAHDFAGAVIKVRCQHEEYQGKPTEKWSLALGKKIENAAPAKISDLNKKFGSLLAMQNKGKKPANNAAPKTVAQEFEEAI